jgi:FkbM family methyltransferase
VSAASERLGQLFLRFASPLAGLRRIPILGPCVSWASAQLVPRDTLVWMQVRQGPARGLWLHLNPRTGWNYFDGGGELEVQAVLQERLKPGMIFYDVGANIGFFSLLAARLVGNEGRVVAFEADPEVAARLREHPARNKFDRITIEQLAVWSEPRTVFFERTDPATSPDRGLGHVVSGGAKNTIQVDAVSLDDYASTGPAPDFVKCDVEGAEVEVFRGALNLLRRKRPIILFEMHSEENRRILLEELSHLGYTCKNCGENHVLAQPQ